MLFCALQYQHHFYAISKASIALQLTQILHTKKKKKNSCKYSSRFFVTIACLSKSNTSKENGFHVQISKIISLFLRFTFIDCFLTSSLTNYLSTTSLSNSFFSSNFQALVSRALATSFSRPHLSLNTIFSHIGVSSYVLVVSYTL